MEAIKEYRAMGESWPKAIRLGIWDFDAMISVRNHVGNGIFRVGERITSLGEGIGGGIWDGSREQSWRDGHEFGLGMGLGDPEAAHRIEVDALRRLKDQRTD